MLNGIELNSVGVDIIALDRLSRVLNRNPRLFMPLCRSEEQPELCNAQGAGLWRAACLWTAKEATAKCLGTGFWRHNVEWSDVLIKGIDFTHLSKSSPQLFSCQDSCSVELEIELFGAAQMLYPQGVLKGQFELIKSEDTYGSLVQDSSCSLHGLARVQLYMPRDILRPTSSLNTNL